MILCILGSLYITNDNDCRNHDKFEKIYLQYGRLMYSKAMQILNDHSLSEDAVSEAFIRIFKNLHKLEDDVPSPKTATFVVVVVRNIALTMLSKFKETNLIPIDEDFDVADSTNTEDIVITKISNEDVIKLINKLDEPFKQVFLMYYGYEMSLKEISDTLNISENLATVRLHRARKKIAKIISEREGGADVLRE